MYATLEMEKWKRHFVFHRILQCKVKKKKSKVRLSSIHITILKTISLVSHITTENQLKSFRKLNFLFNVLNTS